VEVGEEVEAVLLAKEKIEDDRGEELRAEGRTRLTPGGRVRDHVRVRETKDKRLLDDGSSSTTSSTQRTPARTIGRLRSVILPLGILWLTGRSPAIPVPFGR
jgi:hypothetical protein